MLFVAVLFALPLWGQQSLEEFIAANPDRAAGVLHVYETFDTFDTPAPRGYKPFYISHYGRHGSRYHLRTSAFEKPLAVLEAAREEGILSDEGLNHEGLIAQGLHRSQLLRMLQGLVVIGLGLLPMPFFIQLGILFTCLQKNHSAKLHL